MFFFTLERKKLSQILMFTMMSCFTYLQTQLFRKFGAGAHEKFKELLFLVTSLTQIYRQPNPSLTKFSRSFSHATDTKPFFLAIFSQIISTLGKNSSIHGCWRFIRRQRRWRLNHSNTLELIWNSSCRFGKIYSLPATEMLYYTVIDWKRYRHTIFKDS